MYRAMIQKDGSALDNLLDESFVLIHMTGMRQNKQAFIQAIQNGTLNYFSEELRDAEVKVSDNEILFIGKSLVSAAVFGGGRHTWRLRLDVKYVNVGDDWLISEAVASTW